MKRNGAKMIKPNGIAMIALLLLVAAGCATVDEPPQTETTEDLGVGYLDPGDSKADGSWGLATTCKPIPERPALQDRFELSDRDWTHQVKGTKSDFYRVIGAAERILAYAEDIGQQWLQGVGVARLLSQRRAKPKPA